MTYRELIDEIDEMSLDLEDYSKNDEVQPWAVAWLKVLILKVEGVIE
jgi:hypothetical protein